ncbi:MAG TPA: VWA domain-containing protein, partial [Thermoanaerobaculia bacterium]
MVTRSRIRLVSILLALSIGAAAQTASADILPRILLKRDTPGPLAGDFRGETEIVVVPPFEPARVVLELNGNRIATLTSAPYRLEADLGPETVQHTIRVTAYSGKRRVTWESVINRGRSPLSLRLVRRDGKVEAIVTEPSDDPVVEVSFFHDTELLGTRTAPPWVVDAPAVQSSLLLAAAKTRSGREAADALAPNADVLLGDYEWKRVDMQVSVIDEKGSPVTELDASKFRIVDNGETGKIVDFGKVFDQPVSVSLVLDASASMGAHMAAVTRAAQQFVTDAVRPDDRVAVYSVHDVPRRWTPLTSDRAAIAAALESIPSRGNTSLWDSIATAIRELEPEPRRKAIVLLSDGADTDSIRSWKEIVELVRYSAIPLYIIAYNQLGADAMRHRDHLRYLAAESGGFVVDATQKDLSSAWRRIEEDLRARYLITYEVFA